MLRRFTLPRFLGAAGLTAFLAACNSGGGGGPTPIPTSTLTIETPTPVPVSTPTGTATTTPAPGPPSGPVATFTPRPASGVVLSNFNIQSVPAGLAITIANPTPAPLGVTPKTYSPNFSSAINTLTITPSNGNPAYTFSFDQTANGDRTVLYNQITDTRGSIGSVSATSIGRSVKALSFGGAPLLRVPLSRWSGRPLFSASRLEVRYRSTALTASGRSTAAVERVVGATRAVDLGFERNGVRTRVVEVPRGTAAGDLAARLRAQSEVVDVRPVALRYKSSRTAQSTNDTHFNNYDQWSMFQTQAVNGWGYTTGSPAIAIAVIDTGLDYTHQDLCNGSVPCSKIVFGEKVVNGAITSGIAAAEDTDGHGTNVSGIAAAVTNNSFGFAGLGYNTSLMAFKVFDDGSSSASSTDEAQAIYDAVANGAKVINLSLGGPETGGFDPAERDAVEYAIGQGVTVVAAAGNERADGSTTIDFPAAYDGVIAVGASALNDNASPGTLAGATEFVASYSNSGPNLTLVAPGGDPPTSESAPNATATPDLLHWIEGIYTREPNDVTQSCRSLSDCRALFAGTSQATPHVAGAAALLLAANGGLSPARIKQILSSTADDIHDVNQGSGRLNVYRALASVEGDSSGLPAPTFANFVAIAYVPNGSASPQIVDATYPRGQRVASDGTFRIADVPASVTAYDIGVWDDVNGDGQVDAGDYFGTSGACTVSGPCASATGIVVHPVAAGFVL